MQTDSTQRLIVLKDLIAHESVAIDYHETIDEGVYSESFYCSCPSLRGDFSIRFARSYVTPLLENDKTGIIYSLERHTISKQVGEDLYDFFVGLTKNNEIWLNRYHNRMFDNIFEDLDNALSTTRKDLIKNQGKTVEKDTVDSLEKIMRELDTIRGFEDD